MNFPTIKRAKLVDDFGFTPEGVKKERLSRAKWARALVKEGLNKRCFSYDYAEQIERVAKELLRVAEADEK